MASYADMTSGRQRETSGRNSKKTLMSPDTPLDDLDDECLLPGAELFGLRPRPEPVTMTSSLNAAAAIFRPSGATASTGARPKITNRQVEELNEALQELEPLSGERASPTSDLTKEVEVQTEKPVLVIDQIAPDCTTADEIAVEYTDVLGEDLEDEYNLEKLCQASPEYREAMATGCLGPSPESTHEEYRKARRVLVKQMKHLEIAQQLLQNEFDKNNIILDELIERGTDFALRAKRIPPTRQDCEDFCNRMFTLRCQTLLGWQNRDPDQNQRFYDVKHKYVQTQETYHQIVQVITNHLRREEYLKAAERLRREEEEEQQRLRELEIQQQEREAVEELEQARLVEVQQRRAVEEEKLRQLASAEGKMLKAITGKAEERGQAAFFATPPIPPEMVPRPRKQSFPTVDAQGNPHQFGRMSPMTEEERSFEIEDRLRRSKRIPSEPEIPLNLTQDNLNLVSFTPPPWYSRPPPPLRKRPPDSKTGNKKK